MEQPGGVQAPKSEAQIRAKGGKYLTFRLAAEEYGIEILKVQEIIGMMSITKVPRLPEFIRGILNLRGKLVPVIEMRSRFQMERVEDNNRTCIIVVQVNGSKSALTMGILVDSVNEVVTMQQDQLEPTPQLGQGLDIEFMLGMAKIGSRVVLLLDIDRVLTSFEYSDLKSELQNQKTKAVG